MRIARDFGIVLPPPEKVGTFQEELLKFVSENPEHLRFGECVRKLRQSITVCDLSWSCHWILETSKHTTDFPTQSILNSLCEEFIKIFSKFRTSPELTSFLIQANHFYESWERGSFEDCIHHLAKAWAFQSKNCPVTSVLFGVCVDRLNGFKDRYSFKDNQGDIGFLPLIRTEDHIDFFEDW